MPDDAEQQLAIDLRRRRKAAWAGVYDAHAADIFAFVLHLLGGDRQGVDEVHQEIWMAALASIDSFDPKRGVFRGWLFGVARRQVALAYRRRRGKHAQTDHPAEHLDAADSQTTAILPDDVLELVERDQAVRAALAELGPDSRAVLLGKYIDGRTVDELAGRLGRTPKAIESLLSRARGRMRSLLGPYVDSEGDESCEKRANPPSPRGD